MADEDDAKQAQEQGNPEAEKTDEKAAEKTSDGGILAWIIPVVVVLLCAGAGFGLGRLLAGPSTAPGEAEPSEQGRPAVTNELKANVSGADAQKSWYYDLKPVVANLDEPGVTRYVRATLTLEISGEMDQKKCLAFLESKSPLLTNWLTIYLASLSVEDIRGDKNLKRIQSQVLDAFNENLFPGASGQIRKVLFKEFAIQ